MRSESLINNMMQPSPFSEFNPLDVLATAASLQSARIETDDEVSPNGGSSESQEVAAEKEADDDKDGDLKDTEVSSGKPAEEIFSNDAHPDAEVQDKSRPDDSVFQVPAVKHVKFVDGVKGSSAVNGSSKPVTVLHAYRPQMSDHSYAFTFQLQSLKNDEDEGYSSRSSIDEEGEDISASHGSSVDSPGGLQSPTTPKLKVARITVVNKNSGVSEELSSPKKSQVDITTTSEDRPQCDSFEWTAETQVNSVEAENVGLHAEEQLPPVTEVTTENWTEMPEEHTDEVITLDPESVVADILPPVVEEIDSNLSKSSPEDVTVNVDQQDIAENTDHQQAVSETSCDVSERQEDVSSADQREAVSSSNCSVTMSTESERSDATSDANETENSSTSQNDEGGACEESTDVTSENDAEKTDCGSPSKDQSLKNQYIIEDDISPVRKFGSADLESEKDVINVTQLADRGEGTVLVVSKPESKNAVRQQVIKPTQSLLKTSNIVGKTNSSVVRVIPFVNGGRVAQILPRPVQCVTPVKGQNKTIMKVTSPSVDGKKPPSLGKLLMPVTTTTLSSTKGIILKSPVPSPTAAVSSPAVSTDTSLSGRSTPKSIPDTDSVDSDMSPTLKVTMLSGDAEQKEKGKVEKTSIGTVGSLSWKSFGGLIQLGGASKSKEFIRIQGSQIQPREPSEEEATKEDDLSVSLSPNPWAGTSLETASMDDVLSVTNSDDSLLSEPPVMSPVVTSSLQSKRRSKTDKIDPDSRWERCSELHPLIDHDYCMFTEFNAQIQSSIIATTESKTRIDRRYNKKTKSARTKSASLIYEPDKPLRGRPSEKVLKGKKGRLKKKDTARGAYSDDNSSLDVKPAVHSKESEEKALKRQMRLEKKIMAEKKKAERNDRNFVKITGSYKDEFVYYATRNYRGRPRKAPEPLPDPTAKPLKPIPAGGVNDFDWYRDLSRADKTSYFGSPGLQSTESSRHASPAALTIPLPPSEDALMCKEDSIPGSTPIHESDVVDLVCELSGFGGSESFSSATGADGVEISTTEVTTPPSNGDSSLDLNQMAEHVCSMLTSMDENELRMLEKLGEDSTDEKPAGSGLNDTSFDGFLGAPVQGPTQLCDDLDEINDNDLLTTDISNMNDMSDILTDLRSSATAQTTTSADGSFVQAGSSNVSLATAAVTGSFTSEKLDRAELFPDIHAPSLQNRSDATMVPELTVVSMFWNDLPGLMISSVQHVRLVDIHKQVLPAKDTGILKKRCQMLGLDIANCSELQRDFLIRYANAAKSKSTVIVSKQAAEELIGFYVNPKPRGSRQPAEEKEEMKRKADSVSSSLPGEGSSSQPEQPLDVAPPATPTSSRSAEGDEAVPQSRSGKKSRKRKLTGESETNPASPAPVLNVSNLDSSVSLVSTTPAQDVKRSERLRHKKVRYADMANGTAYLEGEEEEEEAKTPDSPAKENAPSLPTTPVLETDDSGLSSDHENRDITLQKLVYPEELEIKKIRLKARKKKLTKQEKRRLKRLKERMQKKALKQKMEKKRMKMLQRQKTSGGKGKRRLQETHAYTKKVNPEHCYAACPAVKEEVHQVEKKEEVEVKEVKEEAVKEQTKAPLAVIHRDNVHRQGPARVGRWQDGEVFLSLYRNKDSPCIQCVTCHDFYTVRRFLKHMHKQNNPDELLEVNLPQKFELRNPCPTDGESQDWQEFQTRRRLVEVSPNERTRKTPTKPAESNNPSQSLNKETSDKKVVTDTPAKAETDTPSADVTKKPPQELNIEVAPEKAVKVEIHLKTNSQENKLNSVSKTEASPEDNGLTRHSTRVRKRKQLHPIESYVYSKLLPANGKPEMREELPGEIDKVSMSVSPVRATKFKVSVRKDGSSQVTRLDVKVPGSEKRLGKRARYSQ